MADITRFRGDTIADDVLIQTADGNPINLTGYTVVMTINKRENPTDTADQVYQITATIPNPLTGVARFTPTTLQANQPPGIYYFDIQLTDDVGVIRTAVKGRYIYVQDITK